MSGTTIYLGNIQLSSAGGVLTVTDSANSPVASNVSALNATGNITTSGGWFIGNGAFLTGLPAGYTNSNVAAYLPTYTGNIAAGNVIVTSAVIASTVNAATIGNTGAIITGTNVTATSTMTAATVNANTIGNTGATIIAGTVSAGTVGNTGTTLVGTLTTAAQPNITSVGNLTSLVVNGPTTHVGNIDITGNINVYSGNLNYSNVSSFVVGDPLVYFGDNNNSNSVDLGFVVGYNPGVYQHGGFVRDATDGVWKLFGNVVAEPTTTVDFTNAIYQPIQTGAITANGNITTTSNVSVGNLLLSGNIIDTGALGINSGANGNITLNAGTGSVILNSGVLNGQANGVGNIGSSTTYFNTVFAKATSAQYADLAEHYTTDAEYEPGTVVMFGGDKEVTICGEEMSRRIAGVVSTNPAYIMNAGILETSVAVALQGRVPTKVKGPVRKGDMMVSAGDGYARAEDAPVLGSVIGKALENFDGDLGVIEVVGRI